MPEADQPIRTLTRTLWGDQCLNAWGGVQSIICTPGMQLGLVLSYTVVLLKPGSHRVYMPKQPPPWKSGSHKIRTKKGQRPKTGTPGPFAAKNRYILQSRKTHPTSPAIGLKRVVPVLPNKAQVHLSCRRLCLTFNCSFFVVS